MIMTAAPSLASSLGEGKLVKSHPYEDVLEELKGAHLRFAASHVSLININEQK